MYVLLIRWFGEKINIWSSCTNCFMGEYLIILFYCITCIDSALYILNTGIYGGEAYSVSKVNFSPIEIIVHLLIVVLGYFCICHFYNRTKDKKTKYKIKYNVKRLDKLYFIFLIISWTLFITAGVGRAVEGGKSSIGYIGAILNVRTLFPFYYVLARRKSLFYPLNILLYCGLRLSQGWTSFFLDLVLFEILIRFQHLRFNNIRKIYATIIPFIVIYVGGLVYSVIYPIKQFIRFKQISFEQLTIEDGVNKLLERTTFFPQSLASIQTVDLTAREYQTYSNTLGEIKTIFRPLIPGFMMDKDFASLSLCIKKSFVDYEAEGTSLNVGIFSYGYSLMKCDFLSFIIWVILMVILFKMFSLIIRSLDSKYKHVLYFILVLNIYTIGSIETVYSYMYLPLLYMCPIFLATGIVKIVKLKS